MNMTLPKKKSRIINIDGVKYRWMVGPNDGYNVFVAEKEHIKGLKIQVHFDIEVNRSSSEFSDTNNLNLKILKPKDAETIIRQALNDGWEPEKKGRPIVFDLKDDRIIKR